MAQHRRHRKASARTPVTEKRLLKSEVVRQAFEELTQQERVDKQELLGLLDAIADASETRPTLVEGMSDRRFHSIPDRIRDWANMIEQVNRSQFLGPGVLPKLAGKTGNPYLPTPLDRICSNPELAKHSAENFERLPRVLRLYADYLRVWTAFLTGRYQNQALGFKRSLRGFRPRTILLLKLMKLVEDSVGRPCEREVVTLVNAAYEAADVDKSVSEDGLRKLKKNNPLPRWSLSPEVFMDNN